MDDKKIEWALKQLTKSELQMALKTSAKTYMILEIYFSELVFFDWGDYDKFMEKSSKDNDFLYIPKKRFVKLLEKFKINT